MQGKMLLLLMLLLLLASLASSCIRTAAAGGDEQPGWGGDDGLQALAERLGRPCTLRRATALPDGLEQATAPLLVRLPAEQWPHGLRSWSEKSAFVGRHGNVRVDAHSALSTAQGGARRAATAGRPLHSVLAEWRQPAQRPARVVLQAAAPSDESEACSAAGDRTWLDPAFREDLGALRSWLGAAEEELLLSVGPNGQGLPRHSHGAAWLAAIVGAKFWVLHPPGSGWAALPLSAEQWLRRLATGSGPPDSVPERAEWCVQQPGEVLIVPPLWHHSTLNLGDSVAVGAQSNALRWETPSQALEMLSAQLQRAGRDGSGRLLELTADTMLQLADSSTEGDQAKQEVAATALGMLGEACDAEPFNTRLLVKAARVAAKRLGRPDKAFQYLQEATRKLSVLEERGSITATDAAEVGGQIGVAVAVLVKAESDYALPLLT